MAEEKKLLKDFIRKDVTQQAEFLKNYPECDGRGLLIAILDTGIDVSFDGMQKTTTGSPKVVDCYDFTGAGCVDTSIVKKIDENNSIIGLSGRSLKIPLKWKNPSGEWHLGIKSVYEMCSGAALESIIKTQTPSQSMNEANENMLTIWNHLQDFTATLSMEFKKVSYELFPENTTEIIKNIYDLDSIKYLKLIYAFEISKETKCCVKMNQKKKYPLLRAQVFTESKKYIHGFYSIFEDLITLLPGKYTIIAYVFFPNSTKNFTLPTIKNLPSITVTMELDHQITPEIYSNSKMNIKSQYTKHKSIKFKNGERQIYLKNLPAADSLSYPSAQNVTFHGSANFSIEDFQLCVPLEHNYTFKNEQEDEVENEEKENVKQIINENLSPETNETNSKNEPETIIPLKFKQNFGSELTDTFFSTTICNTKINDKNDAINENNLTKTQNNVIDICDLNLKNVRDKNIQKELAKIKQSLMLGHLGTTLLHLNKLSIKHQTNPAFKFIDLAIIELLKHLKWDHLVEAHSHALLDRHRNYWRLL